jgi:hypothetical protein
MFGPAVDNFPSGVIPPVEEHLRSGQSAWISMLTDALTSEFRRTLTV